MNKYTPIPIIVEKEQIPETFTAIFEKLSMNVHDTWAAGRFKDGWSYGPERNDEKKEHPSLVPYEELPESEKEYDRATVQATIGVLIEYNLVNL